MRSSNVAKTGDSATGDQCAHVHLGQMDVCTDTHTHTPDETTRKKAPGPSWCRPLSRGVEGRRTWPAILRSTTCPSVATSPYSSLPSSTYDPLSPRTLTPTALPPRSLANRRTRPRTDGRGPSIGLMPCSVCCIDSKVHTQLCKQIGQQCECMKTIAQQKGRTLAPNQYGDESVPRTDVRGPLI